MAKERESRERGKLADTERNSRGRRKRGRRGKRRSERSSRGKRKGADGEVRNVTRNVRQAAFSRDSGMAQPPIPPFSLSFFLVPITLCCARDARAALASAISLTGYGAVRRSSRRRATSRLLVPSEIKASRGPVATNKRGFSRMLAVVFA